jgi:hypothetical protein
LKQAVDRIPAIDERHTPPDPLWREKATDPVAVTRTAFAVFPAGGVVKYAFVVAVPQPRDWSERNVAPPAR